MDDENEYLEVVRLGSAAVMIHTGLDMAMLRARGAFIRGRMEIDEFEREVERILIAREDVRRRT